MVRYNDLTFQPGMLSARRGDGTIVRLSRQERALLLRLVRQPEILVTRAQLLEALGEDADVVSERNVDYLVNRLRRRLGDSARNPKFIATQYGEGYVWIAEPIKDGPISAFLLIGPVFGPADDLARINGFPHRLAAALRAQKEGTRPVLLRPAWRYDRLAPDTLDYTLEINIHFEDGLLHMAIVLRTGASRTPVESFRRTIEGGGDRVDELAQAVLDAIWRHEALSNARTVAPTDRPMHLRLHDAAVTLTDDTISWRENSARLQQEHERDKSDPRLSVMVALNLYTRLLQSLADPPMSAAQWHDLEGEIEALSLRALPDAQGDPQLLLSIAKLLRFIDRGYLDLAERLTNQAFSGSTAFAAAFSMKAQIAASRGDIDFAAALFDRTIEIAEPGSQFYIYLQILKMTAMLAGERRGAVEHLAINVYDLVPQAQTSFGLFFVSPKARLLSAQTELAFAAMPLEKGRQFCDYLLRISARQFHKRIHQRNVLKGFTSHLVRHHGPQSIGPLVAERFPELLAERTR